MPGFLTHAVLLGEVGGAVAWLSANLIAVARRPRTAIFWYAVAGYVEGALAVGWGIDQHQAAWWALGILWAAAKGWAVPRWLGRSLPHDRWELAAAGTPRLLVGSAVLLVLAGAAAGPPGVAIAAVLTAFWLMSQRRELWLNSVLLIEAEVGMGFVALLLGVAPSTADVLDVVEVLWAAGLLAWLQGRARQDLDEPVHTTALRRLRG